MAWETHIRFWSIIIQLLLQACPALCVMVALIYFLCSGLTVIFTICPPLLHQWWYPPDSTKRLLLFLDRWSHSNYGVSPHTRCLTSPINVTTTVQTTSSTLPIRPPILCYQSLCQNKMNASPSQTAEPLSLILSIVLLSPSPPFSRVRKTGLLIMQKFILKDKELCLWRCVTLNKTSEKKDRNYKS